MLSTRFYKKLRQRKMTDNRGSVQFNFYSAIAEQKFCKLNSRCSMRSCLKLYTDKSNGQYSAKKLSGLVYELKPLINVIRATKIRWKWYKKFSVKTRAFSPKKVPFEADIGMFWACENTIVQVSISLSHIPSQRKNKMTIFVSYKLSNHNSYHFSRTPWGTNGPGEASITLKINNTQR